MSTNRAQATISFPYRVSDALPLFANLQGCSSSEFDLILDLLSNFSLFHSIPSTSALYKYGLKDLLPHLQYNVYPPGSAIYHEGVFNTKLYLILKGTVHTFIPKSDQEMQERGNGDAAGIILAKQKVISLKKLALLNNAGPRVLGKLLDEINNRKNEVLLNPSKAKSIISPFITDLGAKKTVKMPPSSFRNSIINVNFKAELDEPKEVKQLEKLSNMLFAKIKPNVNTPNEDVPPVSKASSAVSSANNSQQNTPVLSPKVEEMDEVDILEEIRKTLYESIAENTARILKKFTNKAHKYFLEGQCLFKQFQEYECGSNLGSVNEILVPPDHTAVAITDVHVLICERDNFIRCFQDTIFEREHRINLFNSCLGGFIEPLELNYFMQHFTKRSYAMNEVLFSEGMHADGLYLVYKGEVQLRKETQGIKESDWMSPIRDQRHNSIVPVKHTSLQMVSLGPMQFFGEEALQEDGRRIYKAVAAGWHNEVYFINIEDLNSLKETCKTTLEHLERQYKKKNSIRGQRIQVVAKANHIAVTEGELPFHRYKAMRNFDQYLKPRLRKNSSSSLLDTTAVGEQMALDLITEPKRRDGIQALLKLQGIELPQLQKEKKEQKEPEPTKKRLRRNMSCYMRLESVTGRKSSLSGAASVVVASRKDSSLGGEASCYLSGPEQKQQTELKTTMYEVDVERESPVRKDSRTEENTFARIKEFVKEYQSKLRMKNRSGVLDSSIMNPEISEYQSRVMMGDYEERSQQQLQQSKLQRQGSITGMNDSLDERREKRLRDLFRSNTVLSGRDSEISMIRGMESQRDFYRKESSEVYTSIGKTKEAKKRKLTYMEKIGIAKNMLLYNEISSLVVKKDLDEKHRVKAARKGHGKGSVSARQSVDNKEEKQRSSMMKLKRIFMGKERKSVGSQLSFKSEKSPVKNEKLAGVRSMMTSRND